MPALIALLVVHVLSLLPLCARAQLAGKIDAEFAVSERGSATWTVPIVVPPGTASMQPTLALAYDSQQGNGPLGVGFSLAGSSAITRCPSDLARDGVIRAVAYDAGDRFCLDGQRLVLVSGAHGEAGSEYRTERESWTRVVAVGAGPLSFDVRGRDGVLRAYGSTPDSRIEAQGRSATRVWALARVEDRSGNAVRHSYVEDAVSGEFLLARVDYTENARANLAANASVRFVWEPRADPESGFVAGSRISVTQRLARVETWLGGERVREYRLAYQPGPTTGRSRMATLTVCGLRGECLPPTRFAWLDGAPGWQRDTDWQLPRQLWRETRQEGVLADFDGDGLLDLVHGGGQTQTRTSWRNTGSGFASSSLFRPPADLFSATLGFPHAQLIDLDGDGLPEYVRSYRTRAESVEIATHRNLGDRWESAPTGAWATPTHIWDYKDDRPQQTAVLVDLNGDSLPDFVRSYESVEGNEVRETRLNTGAGFAAPDPRWVTPVRLFSYKGDEHQTQATLVDLSGDGLPELVQAFDDAQSGSHRAVWLNTGSGFSGPIAAWQTPDVIWDYEHASPRQEAELADVNADGLADFVVAYKGSSGATTRATWLNTGAGWLRASDWDLPSILWNYENEKHLQVAQLADTNGDGFPDLVRAYVAPSGVTWRDTWLNTGSGFPSESETAPEYEPPHEVWSYSSDTARAKATFADLDGDGVADFVKAYRTSTISCESHLAAAELGDRVGSITDGLGGTIAIEYAPLTNGSVYTLGERAVFPARSVVDARPVVRRFGIGPDGALLRWTRLRYGGLRADLLRRMELGFAWRESEDESNGIATILHQRQDWPLQGLGDVEERVLRVGAAETLLQRTRHSYASQPGVAAGIAQIEEHETRVERYELDRTAISAVRTTRTFDAFGNVDEEQVDLGEGYSQRVATVYRNDPQRWLLGLPERVEISASAPGFPTQSRVVTRAHDAERGLVVRSVSEPDQPALRVVADLVHDVYGNLISHALRGPDFETRSSAWLYDSRGQFPGLSLDALGHARVRVVDPRFGAPFALRGPDFSLPDTRLGYDALGRLLSTTRPDGVTTRTTRSECGAGCPEAAAMSVRTETPGAPVSTAYLDGLGREVRNEADGFDGRRVRVDSRYDVRGNLESRTRPYYAGEGTHHTTWLRDPVDRVIRLVAPDGAQTTWSRSARSVAVTDARGHTHTELRNVRGELVESIDALGARTVYAADAFGNPALVRDPRGTETSFAYDALGRQIGIDDPDLGTWSYAYDALGQRTAQLDPRGTRTRYTWDVLGRPVRREGDGPTVTWVWDSALHGVGQLARVETPAQGYTREHRYDAYGRPTNATTRTGVTSLDVSQTYDGFGRQATLRYPTGFTLRYGYTGSGHLATVRNAGDGTVYWSAEALSADGRVERERLGNGLLTDRIRDPQTGRLSAILTGSGSVPAVQSLHYGWDALGNLDTRENRNTNRIESFRYDPLDRLERATITGVGTTAFAYDSVGNLVYKTGVGVYVYPAPHEPRPHAVQSFGDDPRKLLYDANGNLIGDLEGRGLVWSARNQPIAIGSSDDDGGWEFLDYTPEGALLLRIDAPINGSRNPSYTLQIGNLFEQVTDLVTRSIETRHMIHAGGGLVAVHVRKEAVPAETRYVHRDHLESIDTVTNAAASVIERFVYDAHGRSAEAPSELVRGFTGHVPLQRSRLVHMQGRVYDPRLGRFLSPDPVVAAAPDLQSLNRYAYVRNNPLSYVDPTGFFLVPPEASGSGESAASGNPVGSAFTEMWNAVSSGASVVSSFMSSAWGGVRFGATATWNGIAWVGSTLSSAARWAGAGMLTGAALAWNAYRNSLPFEIAGGILPDGKSPGGILQNIVRGVIQAASQDLTIYDVTPQPNGAKPRTIPRTAPISGGSLYVNGQLNDLEDAAAKGARAFGDQPFILLHGGPENLVSDSMESAVMKLLPSRASYQLARILAGLTEDTRLVAHSQGTLTSFWGLVLSGGGLSKVAVDFFGAATSSPSYEFALVVAGAHSGPYGYYAHLNDPVTAFLGGNFTGGWLAPLLIPTRLVMSVPVIPLLLSPERSTHAFYPAR